MKKRQLKQLTRAGGVTSIFAGGAFIKAFQILLSFVTNSVMAKSMNISAYGQVSLNLAVVSFLSVSSHFGLPLFAIKHLSGVEGAFAKKRKAKFSSVILTSSFIGAAIAAFLFYLITLLHSPSSESGTVLIWSVAAGLAIVASVTVAIAKANKLVFFGNFVDLNVRQGVALVAFVGLSQISGPVRAGLAQLTGVSLAVAVSIFVLLRNERIVSYPVAPSIKILKRSYVFVATSAGWALSQYLDVILVGFVGSSTSVAVYRVGTLVASLSGVGIALCDMVLAPKIVSLFKQNKKDELSRLCATFSALSLAICVLSGLVILVFGRVLLGLAFGVQLQGALIPSLVLICGQLIIALTGPSSLLMLFLGGERRYVATLAISAMTNAALNLYLVPKYGALGAAVSTVLSVGYLNIYLAVVVTRSFGVRTDVFQLFANNRDRIREGRKRMR